MGKDYRRTVTIHPDTHGNELSWTASRYVETLQSNDITVHVAGLEDPEFWNFVKESDLLIYRYANSRHYTQAHTVIPLAERLHGVRCFPDSFSAFLFNDKLRQHHLFEHFGVPTPRTWVFRNASAAYAFLESATYPLVAKLRMGQAGDNVVLVDNRKTAERLVKRLFGKGVRYGNMPGHLVRSIRHSGIIGLMRKRASVYRARMRPSEFADYYWRELPERNYLLVQEFVPDNDSDTRVVVTGTRAFGMKRWNRPDDFRASGSSLHSFDPESIDTRMIEIAFRVCRTVGVPVMAFDFMVDAAGNPIVIEMGYAYGSSNKPSLISRAPGYWDDTLGWHPGGVDPARFELECILERPLVSAP